MTLSTDRIRALGPGHQRRDDRRPLTGAVVSAVSAGNGLVLVLGLATGILSARVLGPQLRGEVAAAQAWAGITAVALTLGVSQALVVDRNDAEPLIGPLLAQILGTGVFGLVLFGALKASGNEPWLSTAGVLGAASLTAGTVAVSNAAGLAQRHGRMIGEYQLVRGLPASLVVVAFGVLAAARVHDPNAWLCGLGLVTLVVTVGTTVRSLTPAERRLGSARLLPSGSFARDALVAFPTVVGSQVIYRLDTVLVAATQPATSVAYYSIATSAAVACGAVGQSIGMITFSRLRGIDTTAQRLLLLRRSVLTALCTSSAVSAVTIGCLPAAVRLVYGPRFVGAIDPARLLVAAAVPLSIDYLLIHTLLALRAARIIYRVQSAVGLAVILLLVPACRAGSLGWIAAVSVVTYIVSATCLYIAVRRVLSGPSGRPRPDGPPSTTEKGPAPMVAIPPDLPR